MRTARRRSALATLAGSSSVTLVAALQSVVLLPLYLEVLGARTYGAWLATGEAVVWLLALDLGIPNLLTQRAGAWLATGRKREIGEHAATSVIVLSVLGLLVACVGWFVAPLVSALFGTDLTLALRLAAFAVSLSLVSNVFVGLSRGLQDTGFLQAFALAGVVCGFVATAWMLTTGFGVESLAVGLFVRAVVAFVGSALYWIARVDREIVHGARPGREASRDILRHCPGLFAAGMGYALTNNSMVTVAALVFRPEVAAVVGVTRKAADLARAVLDMVGHAAYGGFANLAAQGDRARTAKVYREVVAAYFVAAVGLLSAYVAVNPALIEVWVGPEMFGGVALTVALAVSAGVGGWAYLQASLLRSIGEHGLSSRALVAECGLRIALMVGLAYAFGPVGLVVATIATALVAGHWCALRLRRSIGGSESVPVRVWVARSLPLMLALGICSLGWGSGWAFVLAAGVATVSLVVLLLLWSDPALSGWRVRLKRGAA